MFLQIQHSYNRMGLKGIVRYFKSYFPVIMTCNLVFRKNYGRFINSKKPQLLDEKLMLLYAKDYSHNSLVTQCADKYAVRDYVNNHAGDILTNLLGVYNSASEIDWGNLPNRFVLKCNHGSGYNIIVKDKNLINREDTCRQLDYWLDENYGRVNSELQYKDIKPLIIAEEFLDTGKDTLPDDYKFMCSKGKVLYCLIISEREKDLKRICVDKEYKDLHYVPGAQIQDFTYIDRDVFQKMWGIAENLSADFPLVRVDLYDVKGKVYFGELTFTPHGCVHDYFSTETQSLIGSQVQM